MPVSKGGKSIQRQVGSGQTSSHVFVRYPCSVGLVVPSGASGKVQYTLSPYASLHDNTAHWRDWSRGVVVETTDDVPEGPIIAVRAISASGVIILEVVQ